MKLLAVVLLVGLVGCHSEVGTMERIAASNPMPPRVPIFDPCENRLALYLSSPKFTISTTPEDFGAGHGVDDGDAINAAVKSLIDIHRRMPCSTVELHFAARTYKLNSILRIPDGVSAVGKGSDLTLLEIKP